MENYSKEVFRKIMHCFAIVLFIVWAYIYDDWKISVLYFSLATVVVGPLLFLLSKIPGMTRFFNARKPGEYCVSYLVFVLMYAAVATVCWGIFGERMLVVACVAAWGPGDAAAALIGKKFCKHKIGRKKRKSLEGTIAMFVFSFLGVLITLCIYGKYPLLYILLISFLTAIVTAITELKVLNGFDTFFCPVSAMIILIPAELIARYFIL